jgi:hypothetical protein
MEKFKSFFGKFWFIPALLILSIAGASIYFVISWQKALSKIDELNARNIDLSAEKLELENNFDEQNAALTLSSGLAGYISDSFDKLDKILLDTDTNSLEMINWFRDNCSFYGNDYDVAVYRYGKWETTQERTTEEYLDLKSEIEEFFNELSY